MYKQYLNDNNPVCEIILDTNEKMVLELFYDCAPNTVLNFINLVEKKAYNNSFFHRIINNFMIQGGITNYHNEIKGEFLANGYNNPLKHVRGVISMARTMDKDSATSQFFIVHKDSPHLDGSYAAFGALTDGFDVLDRLAKLNRTSMEKTPGIIIKEITVDKKGKDYPKPKYV